MADSTVVPKEGISIPQVISSTKVKLFSSAACKQEAAPQPEWAGTWCGNAPRDTAAGGKSC